jgi:hypothetical protein
VPEALATSADITVFLGYGWCSLDGSKVAPEIYKERALGIAREICECLRNERFEANWNGELSRKIGVSLTWRRRTLLK